MNVRMANALGAAGLRRTDGLRAVCPARARARAVSAVHLAAGGRHRARWSLFLVAALHPAGVIGRRVYAVLLGLVALAGSGVAGRHVWLTTLPPERVPACGPGLDFMLESFPLRDALSHGAFRLRGMRRGGLAVARPQHAGLGSDCAALPRGFRGRLELAAGQQARAREQPGRDASAEQSLQDLAVDAPHDADVRDRNLLVRLVNRGVDGAELHHVGAARRDETPVGSAAARGQVRHDAGQFLVTAAATVSIRLARRRQERLARQVPVERVVELVLAERAPRCGRAAVRGSRPWNSGC